MTTQISILDFSIGNLYSVEKAFRFMGATPKLISSPEEIKASDRLVLPGVGAFNKCMNRLEALNFIEPLLEFINNGRPFLGICIGMQLLMSRSFEGEETKGFGLISGNVEPIPTFIDGKKLKVPHIGWKCIEKSSESRLLKNIDPKKPFYFVHSYNSKINDSSTQQYIANYESYPITALVEKDNIFGCQFHPEKSRENGLEFLKNFMNI